MNTNQEYQLWREEIQQFFDPKNIEGESQIHHSPSKDFSLSIERYKTGENTWSYTRGIVTDTKSGKIIADIKRNYSHFWHAWSQHHNGNEYLLCGEDYQGQTVVNLTKGTVTNYFPEEGFKGAGFCWTAAYPSPDSRILAVEGCYWACPYEVVFFDFTDPDHLPYKELKRVWDIGKVKGWNDDGTFVVEKEVEIRKSDGIPYDELSQEEQDALDDGIVEADYRTDTVVISSSELLSINHSK